MVFSFLWVLLCWPHLSWVTTVDLVLPSHSLCFLKLVVVNFLTKPCRRLQVSDQLLISKLLMCNVPSDLIISNPFNLGHPPMKSISLRSTSCPSHDATVSEPCIVADFTKLLSYRPSFSSTLASSIWSTGPRQLCQPLPLSPPLLSTVYCIGWSICIHPFTVYEDGLCY